MSKETTSIERDTRTRNPIGEVQTALAVTQEPEASANQAGTTEAIENGDYLAGSASHTVDQGSTKAETAADLEDQSSLPVRAKSSNKKQRGRPKKKEEDPSLLAKIVREAKASLRADLAGLFAKREKIIRKLGEAFEKVLPKASDVCEAIKDALVEEINQEVISARDIERHCLDKWKKKTKPKKIKAISQDKKTNNNEENDKLSFSSTESESKAQERVAMADKVSVTATTKPIHQEQEPTANATCQQQLLFKIARDKFPAVLDAISRSVNECYLRFKEDDYELESIRSDQELAANPATETTTITGRDEGA